METILLIHITLSLILPINVHRSRSKSEYIFGVLICILFPVGGYMISLLLNYGREHTEPIEEEEVDVKVIMDLYKKGSEDIISIEDSLAFNDVQSKRKSIIDVLKRDIDSYINQLRYGLKDEDTETAHYAASAIAEFTRKLDLKLQEAAFLYDSDKLDKEVGYEYYQILRKYIESGILDGSTKRSYIYSCIGLLEELISNGFNEAEYYDYLIMLHVENKNYEMAMSFIDLYFDQGESESAYRLKLELLYELRDFEAFKVVFNQMLKSDLVFSREMLAMVRFWKGVARDESFSV